MKKSLLFFAALAFAGSSYAQAQFNSQAMNKGLLPQRVVQHQLRTSAQAPSIVKKTKSTGTYYTKPEGVYYGDFNPYLGSGYYATTLVVPPYTPITYSSDVSGNWGLWGYNDVLATGNSYTETYPDSYMSELPKLVNGTDSFTLGELNYLLQNGYTSSKGFALTYSVDTIDHLQKLTPSDRRAAFYENNQWYGGLAKWGFINNNDTTKKQGYMYGSGFYQAGSNTYYGDFVSQTFGKPVSPLYLTEVHVTGQTYTKPIPDGGRLAAYVTGIAIDTLTYRDGSTELAYGADFDNIIDTLYASSSDTLDFVTEDTYYSGRKNGTVVFTKPGEPDAFGNVTPEPIVIDQPFVVTIVGLSQEGADFGINAYQLTDEDAEVVPATPIRVTRNGYVYTLGFYSSPFVADISLYGLFDVAKAPERLTGVSALDEVFTFENKELKYNTVKIADDGQSNLTDGATASVLESETGDGLPGAFVETALPWFDSEGNENYTINDLPSWVTGVTVNQLLSGMNVYALQFTAEALPDGTTGRAANITISSDKGAQSGSIYLLQGNATVADGISAATIENVKAEKDNRIFNLAGQQVTKAYKGVVIKNGKKFVQK